MGYAFYELPTPDGYKMKRGYLVRCKCHARGCPARIDRGLAYLCYRCTWYFCGDHLTAAINEADDFVAYECFAGASWQVCMRCAEQV